MDDAKDVKTAPTPKTLIKKLAEVMGEVGRVPKSGRNNFHNYDYATEADIAAAVRDGMAKRHLILVPNVDDIAWSILAVKSGQQRLCTMKATFTVMDGESGETLSYKVFSEGADSGDKAVYKAMTGAEKYALLKLFLIPTGDDPEKDSQEAAPPKTNGTQPYTPKPAAAPKPVRAMTIQEDPRPEPPPSNGHEATSGATGRPANIQHQKLKGKMLWDVDDGLLSWAIGVLAKGLNDPTKARYHDVDRQTMEHFQREATWRAEHNP